MNPTIPLYNSILSGSYVPGKNMFSDECNWDLLRLSGAVFEHPGDSRVPHPELRGKDHSGLFIDTMRMLCRGSMLAYAADQLLQRLTNETLLPDYFSGSPMAGVGMGAALAMQSRRNYIFTEKDKEGVLVCRFDHLGDSEVMAAEEMTTSGGTPAKAIKAIQDSNPGATISDVVAAFLIRCDESPPELEKRRLVCAVSSQKLGLETQKWSPDECPLCAKGSRVLTNIKHVWQPLLAMMRDPSLPMPTYAQFAK